MDFTVLHDTIGNKKDKNVATFYNELTCKASGNRWLTDYQDVYTENGYYLACKMRRAKGWFEWFTEVRGKGSVRYKQSIAVYSEDGATVPECCIKAYDAQGEEVGYKKLSTTYFGYNSENIETQQKEWETSVANEFKTILGDIVVYKAYLEWKEEHITM